MVDFTLSDDHKVKLKQSEEKNKFLDLARESKKNVEHESDSYINCNWCSTLSHQRIYKMTGGLGKKRTSGDHPNNNIIEIGQNIEIGHGDLKRLVDTQTSVKD